MICLTLNNLHFIPLKGSKDFIRDLKVNIKYPILVILAHNSFIDNDVLYVTNDDLIKSNVHI